MIDINNQLKNLSKSLLDAARGIIENKTSIERKTDQELSEAAKVLSAKQKKIDKNHNGKLDAEDFAKLRAEGVDCVIIHSPHTPDIHGGLAEVTHRDGRNGNVSVMFENMKYVLKKGQFKEIPEETEELDELSAGLAARAGDAADNRLRAMRNKRKFGTGPSHAETKLSNQVRKFDNYSDKKQANEEVVTEAPVDGVAAGSMDNDGHLCATKVFHKEWNEGTPVFSQHAEPDADGNIAWYDVMFEHGIEKGVSIDDLDVLMAESHERHGKRKMKEEVELEESAKIAAHLVKRYGDNVRKSHVMSAANDFGVDPSKLAKAVRKKLGVNSLDEARGRPRKNPMPAGQSEEPEPRQHIIQQLQRAKLSMRGGEHVTFKDGTKHHISGDHAATILAKYSGMRPAQKEEYQKKISSSHAAFKAEL